MDTQFLVNNAVSSFKIGIKKLKESQQLLELVGHLDAANAISTCIGEMEEKLESTKSLAKVVRSKKKIATKHPLQDYFYNTWQQLFPSYGRASGRDFKELKDFFVNLSTSHPNANEQLVRRMINNYRLSSADWCKTKEMHIFCRNYRKFIDIPVVNFNTKIIEQRDNLTNNKVNGRGVAGLPGIYIPEKQIVANA
jgi:hypothetical protein